MRAELLDIKADLLVLQARLNALLSPEVSNVPSLQQAITAVDGMLERAR